MAIIIKCYSRLVSQFFKKNFNLFCLFSYYLLRKLNLIISCFVIIILIMKTKIHFTILIIIEEAINCFAINLAFIK